MSHPSIYESNIDFLLKNRQRFPFFGWSSLAIGWSSPATKRAEFPEYIAAQVSDQLSVWMWKTRELLEQNVSMQGLTQLYRGWPIEIRQSLIAPPKSLIDYSAITKEICGVH